MRISHTKSRTGCKECKKRHRKCDESAPICLNCSLVNRPCSYRFSRPSYRLRPGPRWAAPTSSPPSTPAASTASPTSTACSTPASTGLAPPNASAAPGVPDIGVLDGQPQLYTLGHLELLHNLSFNVLVDSNMLLLPLPICKIIMQHALRTPYLMDQVLALSASHMSSVRLGHGRGQAYRDQAMLLQTRALTSFNSAGFGISAHNGCSWFLYASLLGLQSMFDTFRSHSFEGFLGQLSTYLAVHRGVLAVIRQTWGAVKDLVDQIIEHCSCSWLGGLRLEDGQPRECGVLASLIDRSDRLGPAEREACREASDRLQWLFDLYRDESQVPTQYHFTVAWTITMPALYAEMLQTRRPEALVIFAFYAVLLHRSRSFWIFGGSGRFLIESISHHLGESWELWLEYPKAQLEKTKS